MRLLDLLELFSERLVLHPFDAALNRFELAVLCLVIEIVRCHGDVELLTRPFDIERTQALGRLPDLFDVAAKLIQVLAEIEHAVEPAPVPHEDGNEHDAAARRDERQQELDGVQAHGCVR